MLRIVFELTFLLIIDFVFGGSDYTKSDAVRNVGNHTIQFAFKFNEAMKYYARETTDADQVMLRCKHGTWQSAAPTARSRRR